MKLVDTHTHLSFKSYDNDREAVIKKLQKEGVVCIEVGTCYTTSQEAVKLAQRYKNIFASIGLHPLNIKTDLLKMKRDEEEKIRYIEEGFNGEIYKNLIKYSSKVVAIGEIGLDYYYRPKTKVKLEGFKRKQKEVFLEQLKVAQTLSLPVILHCRLAHKEMIEILKKETQIRGVIHCFSGTLQEMKDYLKLGLYIGFNGIIFKLPLDESIKECPLEKLLVETDCPYLSPPQKDNQRNEPSFVKYVVEKIAKLKGLGFDQLAQITTQNAIHLFGLS